MSKVQMLRSLVNERLTAAAEEIFALFERTIAEYEEELCGSKEENERRQQLLDSVLSPQVRIQRTGVRAQTVRKDGDRTMKQENILSTQIKEESKELKITKDQEQLQEFSILHFEEVKPDISLYPHGQLHSETEEHTDNDEDWEPPASSSTQQMETDHYNQVTSVQNSNTISPQTSATVSQSQMKYSSPAAQNTRPFSYRSTPERSTFINNSFSERYLQEKPKLFMCPICKKICRSVHEIVTHIRVHSGEKPFRCPVCTRGFAQRGNLNTHLRIHTGERPFSCTECNARFTRRPHLRLHMSSHGALQH